MMAPAGQPPLSVMGINVFQKSGTGKYLVGSFNGLYDWNLRDGVPWDGVPRDGVPRDHLTGQLFDFTRAGSKPFGEEMVSGYLKMEIGKEVYFDYNRGGVVLNSKDTLPPMPREILEKSRMSWWNFALEVHTGRILKPLIGDFYILIVPLMGIFGTILVISGFIVWIKLYVRKNR
jgi:hypothetical protein